MDKLHGYLRAVAMGNLGYSLQIHQIVVTRHVQRTKEVHAVYMVYRGRANGDDTDTCTGLHFDIAQQLVRYGARGRRQTTDHGENWMRFLTVIVPTLIGVKTY